MSRLRYIYSSNFKAAPDDILAKILLKKNTYTRLTLSLKTNMYFIYVLVSKYTLVKVSSVLQKNPSAIMIASRVFLCLSQSFRKEVNIMVDSSLSHRNVNATDSITDNDDSTHLVEVKGSEAKICSVWH